MLEYQRNKLYNDVHRNNSISGEFTLNRKYLKSQNGFNS
jgi:hypothetical protein